MTGSDLGIILSNPNAFPVHQPRFNGRNILQQLRVHEAWTEIYLKYGRQVLPEEFDAIVTANINTKTHRNDKVRNDAFLRDSGMCVITGISHPEMCHLVPHAATSRSVNLAVFSILFEITRTLISPQYYYKWRDLFTTPHIMEMATNLVGLGRHLHNYLDRGILALKPVQPSTTDHPHTSTFIMTWLPVCGKGADEDVQLCEDHDDDTDLIYHQLEQAFLQSFPPRQPEQGEGWIGAHFNDGALVSSGHLGRVRHNTLWERDMFDALMTLQYETLRVATLRGRTERAPNAG
ncbi:hypothetical protein FLONG3_10718 [Fusarium longipes]|uniref:HNH nuclease domain-containing protein n=1 Tax=Fusarium longipes TaxID=694270 RepID=A0A395RLZ8_9HYPO|nr:hypothetical protein FLONG3_10718 [Fusarium longipes]